MLISLWAVVAVALGMEAAPQPAADAEHADRVLADSAAAAQAPLTTAAFIDMVQQDGQFEIEAAQLAQRQAASEGVKSFARQMIVDHGQANQELATLGAQLRSDRRPVEDTALDGPHRERLAQLARLSGHGFDKAYVAAMHEDHERAVALFTRAQHASELPAALREFAARTLPVLQKHHELVSRLTATSEN